MNRIILAGPGYDVQLLNEDAASELPGLWLTQKLNRNNPGNEYSLQRVTLFYAALADTELKVSCSGDGGATFLVSYEIVLDESPDGICSLWFDVTGHDLRLLFEFPDDEDEVLMLSHFTATLSDRGPYAYPRL